VFQKTKKSRLYLSFASHPPLDELSLLFTGAKASSAANWPTDTTTTEVVQDGDEGGDASIAETRQTEISDPATLTSKSQFGEALPDAVEDGTGATGYDAHQMPKQPSPTPAASPIHPNLLAPLANCPPHPLFVTEQLGVDRRLIVNRKRQLKMYRVWMQGKFRKL
jgi:tRNAThr (cytosine32-N3)-methyltransferase